MTRDEQATALDFPAAGSVTGIAIRWWFGPQRASVTREAAEEAIRRAADAGHHTDAVGDVDALERLVDALTDNLWAWTRHAEERGEVRGAGWRDWQKLTEELDAGEVFWLDELAAAWLERSGEAGGLAAAKLRTEAQERADAYRAQEELPLMAHDVWLVHTGERDEQGNEVVRLHSGPLSALHPETLRARAEPVAKRGEPHRAWNKRHGGPWPVFAAWLPADGERVPLFGKRLAWALWLDEVGPAWERGRRHEFAVSWDLGQAILDLDLSRRTAAAPERAGGVVLRPERRGAEPLEVGPWEDDPAPLATAQAVEAALGRDVLRLGTYAYLVLHHVALKLHERMGAGDVPWDAVPVLELATGKRLAEEVGAGTSGRLGREVEEALHLLSALEVRGGRGSRVRLWHYPERRGHGGGRAAAWLVTPGELLKPTYTTKQQGGSDSRRLVYLPDVMPDRDVVDRSQAALVARLALALALGWRKAAGRQHGRLWLERPGLELGGAEWGDVGAGLERAKVLHGLEATGWLTVCGDLLLPGERLPKMRAALDGWARRRARGKRRFSGK